MIEQKNQNNIQQSPTRVQRWNYMHVKLIKCSYSSESIISSNNSFEYNTLFSLRWKEYISRVLYVWWKTCQKMIIDDWNMSLLRVSRDTYAFFFLKRMFFVHLITKGLHIEIYCRITSWRIPCSFLTLDGGVSFCRVSNRSVVCI